VGHYTAGFPAGSVDWFRVVKSCVPGPFTFIMPASKNLPKQVTDFEAKKSKVRARSSRRGGRGGGPGGEGGFGELRPGTPGTLLSGVPRAPSARPQSRKTVGVRIPDDEVCRELLGAVGAPLLVTTAPSVDPGDDDESAPNAQSFVELYDMLVPRGLDFVVSRGHAEAPRLPTTVVDMTGREPVVVRAGEGEAGRRAGAPGGPSVPARGAPRPGGDPARRGAAGPVGAGGRGPARTVRGGAAGGAPGQATPRPRLGARRDGRPGALRGRRRGDHGR